MFDPYVSSTCAFVRLSRNVLYITKGSRSDNFYIHVLADTYVHLPIFIQFFNVLDIRFQGKQNRTLYFEKFMRNYLANL